MLANEAHPDDGDTAPLALITLRAAIMRSDRSEWLRHNHAAMMTGELEEAWRVPWWAHIVEVMMLHGWHLEDGME